MWNHFTKDFTNNDALVRFTIVISFFITSLVIIFGSLLNYHGMKYSILKAPFEQFHCHNLVVTLSLPNSEVCCDSAHGDSWLCIALLDQMGKIFASWYAWIIPLSAATTTLVVDLIQINVFQFSNVLSRCETRSTILLSFLRDQSTNSVSQSLAVIIVFLRKAAAIILIIVFRLVRSCLLVCDVFNDGNDVSIVCI